jgi:outer membrane murein-binding lipoprotein Lpp
MVVNVRAGQRGAQPQWFIRACWYQGPGGHVHVVTPARPGQAAAPAASQSVPGGPSETPAHQPGQDIAAALQSLAQHVSELQADNDRLREDYDQLSAEIGSVWRPAAGGCQTELVPVDARYRAAPATYAATM